MLKFEDDFKYEDNLWPNQIYQTKPNIPNQIYQTKLLNQTKPIKPTKPNLNNQTN